MTANNAWTSFLGDLRPREMRMISAALDTMADQLSVNAALLGCARKLQAALKHVSAVESNGHQHARMLVDAYRNAFRSCGVISSSNALRLLPNSGLVSIDSLAQILAMAQ